MTDLDMRVDSFSQDAQPTSLTYDLLILHRERIIFHGYYDSPQERMHMCSSLLTASDVLNTVLNHDHRNELAQQVYALTQSHIAQWSTTPDGLVNAIAKLCRTWGLHIYVSSTEKKSKSEPLSDLYSVVTDYGSGQSVAEHFARREDRRAALLERAGLFMDCLESIPEIVRSDENRLAAFVSTFIMPANVILTHTRWDAASSTYRPVI